MGTQETGESSEEEGHGEVRFLRGVSPLMASSLLLRRLEESARHISKEGGHTVHQVPGVREDRAPDPSTSAEERGSERTPKGTL